jgi:hypothetical protein
MVASLVKKTVWMDIREQYIEEKLRYWLYHGTVDEDH